MNPQPATDRYELKIVEPGCINRWIRFTFPFGLGVLNSGGSATDHGGRKVIVIDRVSQTAVFKATRRFGDEDNRDVSEISEDIDTMTIQEFEEFWLDH